MGQKLLVEDIASFSKRPYAVIGLHDLFIFLLPFSSSPDALYTSFLHWAPKSTILKSCCFIIFHLQDFPNILLLQSLHNDPKFLNKVRKNIMTIYKLSTTGICLLVLNTTMFELLLCKTLNKICYQLKINLND